MMRDHRHVKKPSIMKLIRILVPIVLIACLFVFFHVFAPGGPASLSEEETNTEQPIQGEQADGVNHDVFWQDCFDLFKADAEGHAWENAYLLALACHYNYPDKLDVKPFEDVAQFERKYEALSSLWGVDRFDFVERNGKDFDTEFLVMSKSDGDFVIVVFRGSERIAGPVSAFKDGVLTDANCTWKDVSEFLGEGVMVHTGFWNAFYPVKDDIVRTVEKHGGFSSDRKLWITGNSLGAALADLCAIWLRKQGHNVQGVYTYGSPRCGNEGFRDLYDTEYSILCQRWVNGNDIVPLLPPKSLFPEYRHVGVLNTIGNNGNIVLDREEWERTGNPLKHYQELYVHGIYDNLPEAVRKKMPPPPPIPALAKPFNK